MTFDDRDPPLSFWPLVSIVMPSFNHEPFVSESIESILAQRYPNLEIFIVDDGSTDNTLAIARKYETLHENLTVVSQRNLGVSAALNKGLSLARGEFVAMIASDDIMQPDKTMQHVEFLTKNPRYAVVAGECRRIDVSGVFLDELPRATAGSNEIVSNVLDGCVFHPLAATFRMSALRDVGFFKAGIVNEDWYIQIMLSKAGFRFYSIPTTVAHYRVHGKNTHLNIERSLISKRDLANCFGNGERKKIIAGSYRHAMALTLRHFGLSRLLLFVVTHFSYLIRSGVIAYLPSLAAAEVLRRLKPSSCVQSKSR